MEKVLPKFTFYPKKRKHGFSLIRNTLVPIVLDVFYLGVYCHRADEP